jgi:serine/threonine protein phosphatase 1
MNMTLTYVFPDLHGRLDHYNKAMDAVGNDGACKDDTLVFLGDYIDRGPDSASVVEALRSLSAERDRVVCLSGNHEMMMLWALSGGDEQVQGWVMNGGDKTLESYTNSDGIIDIDVMHNDGDWFIHLPAVYQDDHRVYVHAGVAGDWQNLDVEDLDTKTLHWHRYGALDCHGYRGKHVVHGHTPNKDGPITVGSRTAMDVGSVWTGRYVVGVFDNSVPGGPVRVIEVHGQD